MNKWLILDKPAGMTSTKAGSLIKRACKAKSLGHAGTLDPFATGVLPLALGEATKSMPYVVSEMKEYEFDLTFGEQRDSGDTEGNVVATSDVIPTEAQIQEALPHFRGVITQIPPVYSALKIEGRRACDLARQGQVVEMKPRQIEVFSFDFLGMSIPNVATFRVSCGPGTYIRSLGSDLAVHLGSLGYVSRLCRTRVGKFTLKDSVKLDIILEECHDNNYSDWFLSIRDVLDDIPALPLLDEESAIKIRHGQSLWASEDLLGLNSTLQEGAIALLLHENKELALAQFIGGYLYPKRLFIL